MRIVVCGQYGLDMKNFDMASYPSFKHHQMPNKTGKVKYPTVISPFIFTDDALRVSELPGTSTIVADEITPIEIEEAQFIFQFRMSSLSLGTGT